MRASGRIQQNADFVEFCSLTLSLSSALLLSYFDIRPGGVRVLSCVLYGTHVAMSSIFLH